MISKELLDRIYDFLNNDIATLPCESRVRTMSEHTWETAMYLRDLIDEERESLANDKGPNAPESCQRTPISRGFAWQK